MAPLDVDMSSVRRVLIIKLSAFGDIMHALPVSAALQISFPHLELTWIVDEPLAPLIEGNPFVKDILTLPRARGPQLRSLSYHRAYFQRLRDVRKHSFDLTIDLQGLTKSALLAAVSGAPIRLAYHWLREAASFFERAVPRNPTSIHIVDQYLDVARYLGANVDCPQFPFHIPWEDDGAVKEMLAAQGIDAGIPFIAINPASAAAMKQWSAANYGALIDVLFKRLRLRAVLVTADKSVAAAVAASSSAPLANLAGQTNLKQLAAVLRMSAVHVCGDTGSGHMAAALHRPVIALIGPTDADRICPFGQRTNVIQHREMCGGACNWHHCQFVHPKCLESISVGEVASHVERALSQRC